MQCDYFDSSTCRSCTLMGTPYAEQLEAKERTVRAMLAPVVPDAVWQPAFANRESQFRNKAKLVVGGSIAQPTLGILDRGGIGVDLRNCGLYEAGLAATFPALSRFVQTAGLTPYNLTTRRGELKNLILTYSPDGQVMVRFVLRSQESIARIRKHLPALLAELPQVVVASANILPEHKAVLEGDQEIPLSQQESLPIRVNDTVLHLRARSFFQTSTVVAAGLYRQAQQWVSTLDVSDAWDLYCGVGGFALHLARAPIRVVGVETSREAVASARLSAAEAGLRNASFVATDSAKYATGRDTPDLVVVNPPRRGIGDLADRLERSDARHVIYSSCNAQSLARDLARMPSLQVADARLFDMFPQTAHHEVMVLLSRR